MKSAILFTLLLTAAGAFAQKSETCKHCPVDLDKQFPEAPLSKQETRVTFTKAFFIPHAVSFLSVPFDVEMTHQGLAHHRCLEGGSGIAERHVSRTEMYGEDFTLWAVGTTFDWMFAKELKHASRTDKKIFFFLPYMFAGPQTALHLKGGIEWYERCW